MTKMMDKHGKLFLDQLLSLGNDAVTIINKDGEVLYWNEAAEKIYHIPQQAILRKKIAGFFEPEDLMVLRILNNPYPIRGVYHRPRPDSHVLINASPVFDAQNQLIGAISVEQNITQLVKLNDELTQTSSLLDQLKSQVNHQQVTNPFSTIKGHSKEIQNAIQLAGQVANTDATILITGESGVGKELFARAIHEASSRKENAFIPINCGAIPPALFESELFGYESGAFTGAAREGKKGKLEMADGGTLFLDEVGELPAEMQVKLLRALQEKEFYRVGGTKTKKINVRIITATNRNLEKSVEEGTFRQDLFYRLNVVSLSIPPLRERSEDILELLQIFLIEFSAKYEKDVPSIPAELLTSFLQYHWPGNIRQLRNMIERYVILSDTDHFQFEDFQDINSVQRINKINKDTTSLKNEKMELEKKRIVNALQSTYGNKSAAAKKLGISRAGLYQKIKQYDIMWEV